MCTYTGTPGGVASPGSRRPCNNHGGRPRRRQRQRWLTRTPLLAPPGPSPPLPSPSAGAVPSRPVRVTLTATHRSFPRPEQTNRKRGPRPLRVAELSSVSARHGHAHTGAHLNLIRAESWRRWNEWNLAPGVFLPACLTLAALLVHYFTAAAGRRTDGVPRRRCARICSRRLVVEVSRAATESDPDACHPAAVARVTLVTGGATESMRRAATASQGLWSLGAWWWRAPSRRGEAAPRGERAHGACARGVWEQARDRISAAA